MMEYAFLTWHTTLTNQKSVGDSVRAGCGDKPHVRFGRGRLMLLSHQGLASYLTPQESRPERRAEESSVQDEGRQGNRLNLMRRREMRRGQRERSGNWRAGCLESLHVRFARSCDMKLLT